MKLACELCGWAMPPASDDPLASMLSHKQEHHPEKDPRDVAFVMTGGK